MPTHWHRHILANVFWSHNGWREVDPDQEGKTQFKWTHEHPDDHADASLFNWSELEEYGGYVPANVTPRRYVERHNGAGLLFIASKNHLDCQYYIVGFLADCEFHEHKAGWIESCNLADSVRFARYIPLTVERHCPELQDGRPRTARFGQNNFNYLRDEWARTILEDALAAQPRFRSKDQLPDCTYTGETPRKVIQRVLKSHFTRMLVGRA